MTKQRISSEIGRDSRESRESVNVSHAIKKLKIKKRYVETKRVKLNQHNFGTAYGELIALILSTKFSCSLNLLFMQNKLKIDPYNDTIIKLTPPNSLLVVFAVWFACDQRQNYSQYAELLTLN